MSLLTIKNILLDGEISDICIEGNTILKIGKNLPERGKIIRGAGKAAIAGFVNCHTHAAMTLFRGFGDDLPLNTWLEQKIWPNEARLNKEYVYWGSKLACLEMIKSGTTTFLDMYYYFSGIAQAVEEMGMRAIISSPVFDRFNPEYAKASKKQTEELFLKSKDYSDRIRFSVAPHAIYTVSESTYRWCSEFSTKNNVLMQTHLAETKEEIHFSLEKYDMKPIKFLQKIGVLNPSVVAAHCLWLDDKDIAILSENDVKVVHNPNSNLKLGSGYQFPYEELRNSGTTIGLGTDGCSSSNNLDMIEAMKTASLLQKAWRLEPTKLPATEILKTATENGGIIAGQRIGKIEEGYLADIVLVDLSIPAFTPNHNFVSNLVYAANGSCIDTVICDGEIIMENKHVEGEEEIIFHANRVAKELFNY